MIENDKIPDFIRKIVDERYKKDKARKLDYIIAVIINIVLLYIFNNLLNWNIYFITNALNNILWIINISIIATILLNVLFLLYNPPWFRNLGKIFLNIFAFISIYVLYTTFPFSFSIFFIEMSLKFALLVTMAVLVVVTIIEFILLIFFFFQKPK